MTDRSGPFERQRSEQLLRALCDVATRLIAFELDPDEQDAGRALDALHEIAAMMAETIEILTSIEHDVAHPALGELCSGRARDLIRIGQSLASARDVREYVAAAEHAQRELVSAVQAVLAGHEDLA